MVKEKLIHWRNIHSPLLYNLAKHINGHSKHWDIKVDDGSSPLERVKRVLQEKALKCDDYRIVLFDKKDSYEIWNRYLESGKWDLTLRAEGFGLLLKKEGTKRKHLALGGRLSFFNS
tara:strand:- start:274 stop:624 length:351 start_codon:yes stop_codon:yes gene_type:complete